jgi:hypothetical protein
VASTNKRNLLRRLVRRRGDLPVLLEAVIWLLVARFILRLSTITRAVSLLIPTRRLKLSLPVSLDTLARVRWAVRLAARKVPWRALCFEQGIAAQRMLMRRGIAADLVYGVARHRNGSIEAHVWTRVADHTVVGGSLGDRFNPIVAFVPGVGVVECEIADEPKTPLQ